MTSAIPSIRIIKRLDEPGATGNRLTALLFYYPKDLGLQHFLAGSGHVDADQVQLVAQVILSFGQPVEVRALQEELRLSQTRLTHILTRLEELEVIEMLPTGEVAPKKGNFDLDDVAENVVQMHDSHRKFEHSRVEMMRGYAEVGDCRREYLLNYFGEEFDELCGYCDNCDRGVVVEEDEENMPFPLNSRVMHKTWGEGLVVRYEGDKMVVLFDSVGYKTLSVIIVQERELLTGKVILSSEKARTRTSR